MSQPLAELRILYPNTTRWDDYALYIRGTIDESGYITKNTDGVVTVIRLFKGRESMENLYIESLHHDGDTTKDVTWTIEGKQYTFNYEMATDIFGAVEEWFWDYADADAIGRE